MKTLSVKTQDLVSLFMSLNAPEEYKFEIQVRNNSTEKNIIFFANDDTSHAIFKFIEQKIYISTSPYNNCINEDHSADIEQLVLRIMKNANAKIILDETGGKINSDIHYYQLDIEYPELVEILKIEFGLKKETDTDLTITIN